MIESFAPTHEPSFSIKAPKIVERRMPYLQGAEQSLGRKKYGVISIDLFNAASPNGEREV